MGRGTDAASAAFEAALDRALGARLRSDEAACRDLWSALANTEWRHGDGGRVVYTFRHASEVAATIRG